MEDLERAKDLAEGVGKHDKNNPGLLRQDRDRYEDQRRNGDRTGTKTATATQTNTQPGG